MEILSKEQYALLAAKAQKGDAQAFGRLYEQVYADLYRFALYTLGSREEAEDAVQETALQTFRGISSLKQPEAFRGWIFKILNTRCSRGITQLMRQRGQTPVEELDLPQEDFSTDTDLSLWLRDLLDGLEDQDRQLVLLSVIGGFSGKEIARMLHRPEGTLRSRLHRALKKLRAQLSEREEVSREQSRTHG